MVLTSAAGYRKAIAFRARQIEFRLEVEV